MTTDCDVLVVGAGPAGATCAWFAARAGLRVIIVDAASFPRDKVCGDAISRTKAVSILQEMGVLDEFDRRVSLRYSELLFVTSDGARWPVAVGQQDDPVHRACRIWPRREFDAWLLDQVRPHVTVIEGFRVAGLVREAHGVAGVRGYQSVTGHERTFRSRIVVGADGVYSVVARAAGLFAPDAQTLAVGLRVYARGISGLTHRMEFHFNRRLLPGALCLCPCGDGIATVTMGLLKQDLERQSIGLTDLFHRVIAESKELKERFQRVEWLGPSRGWTIPWWTTQRQLSTDGVLLVGDAASLAFSVTGEGIGNAMVSGKLAAHAMTEALASTDTSAAALRQYDRRLWHLLGHELMVAHCVGRALRTPGLIQWAIRCGATDGWVGRMMRAAVTLPGGRRRLLSLGSLAQMMRAQAIREGIGS